MTPETQQPEYPYSVKIETPTGQSTTVPIAFLTPKQVEDFLQFEFKRVAQEVGVKGARIHVERAVTADYEKFIREVTACLRSAMANAARPGIVHEPGTGVATLWPPPDAQARGKEAVSP